MCNMAYKYRLYPNEQQCKFFAQTFGCTRKYWNVSLEQVLACLQSGSPVAYDTPAKAKVKYPYMKSVDSLALANVQLHLKQAVKNHLKDPKKFGEPKFKKKYVSKKSYTTNNQHGTVVLYENAIRLPKVGIVPCVVHRHVPDGYVLKSATVAQDKDGRYYVSVLYEYEEPVSAPVIDTDNAVGLDYKSDGFFVSSEGETVGSPKFYRKLQRKLARAERTLSRKKGSGENEVKSRNYLKQLHKINRIYSKIKHCRKDFLHKLSTEIANQYDIVCVEDLNMKSLANKGFGNGKATMDNGFGMFRVMLAYKLERRGKVFQKVSKWYPSSQLCHTCGYQNPDVKDLRIRKWTCPVCGVTHDRDVNAAINIKTEGVRLYLTSCQ